ncbi:MAG: hypothetical protein HY305_04035 [Sphingobacteriales bacterium]|nr:hypothetical protein [Sphingobacteriales bacterium]
MKKINILVVTIITVLFSACLKKAPNYGTCTAYGLSAVTAINAPDSGFVTDTIPVKISLQVYNTCGQFAAFIDTAYNGDTTILSVLTKYDGCTCNNAFPIRDTIYKFTKPTAGKYFLKFQGTYYNSIIDSIVIH